MHDYGLSDYKKILGKCRTYDDPRVWDRVKSFISKNKIELENNLTPIEIDELFVNNNNYKITPIKELDGNI